jgi:hypothetical protein
MDFCEIKTVCLRNMPNFRQIQIDCSVDLVNFESCSSESNTDIIGAEDNDNICYGLVYVFVLSYTPYFHIVEWSTGDFLSKIDILTGLPCMWYRRIMRIWSLIVTYAAGANTKIRAGTCCIKTKIRVCTCCTNKTTIWAGAHCALWCKDPV